MLHLGTTRVEIGVQSTDSDLLIRTKRGHGAQKNVEAIKLVKDNGLKVCAHWIPGLTGIDKLDLDKELEMFKQLFSKVWCGPVKNHWIIRLFNVVFTKKNKVSIFVEFP